MTNSKDKPKPKLEIPDFPNAPDYIEKEFVLPLEAQLTLMEEMLPFWNKDRLEKLAHLPILTEEFFL